LRIIAHLRTFQYSLDVAEPENALIGRDPVETFLFETQAGHCEYFATALAVLLREAGVPTRIVNGYYGAHYNALGDFYAVRQSDAHSWVEVHFGSLGWATFDPTPDAGRLAGDDAARWPALAQALDAVRNAYLEYVIDYDLQKQLSLLKGLGATRTQQHRLSIDWKRTALGGGFVVVVAGLVFLRRTRRAAPSRAEQRLYARVLGRYAALGFAKRPSESAPAWARRVASAGAPGSDVLTKFARLYDTVRFGPGAAAPTPELRGLARQLLRRR